jgi:hypothetical protein
MYENADTACIGGATADPIDGQECWEFGETSVAREMRSFARSDLAKRDL